MPKRANEVNINSKTYWNGIYGTPEKRGQYADQGTDYVHSHGNIVSPTKRFEKTLEFVKDGDKFLDIGCGVGVMTKLIKNTYPNCEVWGVDISDVAIAENAKERPDITYMQHYIGGTRLPKDAYFDVVFAGEVVEHLDDPLDVFKDAYRALKPGGMLIVTTPREEAIKSPEHTWFFTENDIDKLYTDTGFSHPRFVFLPDMEHLLVLYAVGVK